MTKEDWRINIENMVARIVANHGKETVKTIFANYGATCFVELSECYYDEVFSDLMLIDSDD